MDVINNNPYRFLGVYSNSPTKERVANKGKMNAFLKVGKEVSFPLDLPNLLPTIARNVDSLADAESKLALPIDQIRYAQFWWMNATPIDQIAFNHLFEGDIDMAISFWEKKDNVSSLQNRIVLALAQGETLTAIPFIETLYTQYVEEFICKVVGDSFVPEMPLWQLFFDTLSETGSDIQSVVNTIRINTWKVYIVDKTVGPLIDSITKAIATAKSSKGNGAIARLKAGQKLMSETKKTLLELKQSITSTDIRYQTVADKLATEILQCGIDYYNDSDEDDSPEKAMELQKYALTISVGNIARQRCKENVDILQKVIDELPPASVMAQYRAIHEELRKFCNLPDKISYAITLLKATLPHLQKMKSIVGISDKKYLRLSTLVVNNALHNLIEEVNSVQQEENSEIDEYYIPRAYSDQDKVLNALHKAMMIKSALREAWDAILLMDRFDMEFDFKTNRYDVNRRTLKGLCNQVGILTDIQRTDQRRSTTLGNQRTNHTSISNTQKSTNTNNDSESFSLPGWLAFTVGVLCVGLIGALLGESEDGEGFFIGCIIGLFTGGPFLRALIGNEEKNH